VSDGRDPRPFIVWTIAMVVLAVLLCWAMYQARAAILIIYVSALFAIGFSPLVRLVERRRIVGTRRFPRWLAILTIYLAIICTFVGIGMLVLPSLVEQGRALVQDLPAMIARGQQWLIDRGLLDHQLTWREAVQKAPKDVAGMGSDAVTTVLGALVGVAGGLFGIITILILTFYMLVDADKIFASFLRLFPRGQRLRVAAIARDITVKVSAWLGGQLLLGAIIGVTATIGLWLIGVPFFFVLGLLAAIGELIPMVGPILAAIPALAVALTVSPGKAAAVAIFFLLQQQFENHVLVPKVMEKQVGVSPVIVIAALLVGGSLLGIVGAVLAVPTAAALQVIFEDLTEGNA
jgi:predicted PurR-regulated permease PerM